MKTLLAVLALSALALAQLQPSCSQGLPGLTPYLTQHFQNWLKNNGYSSYDFVRSDLPGGSFGGKQDDNDGPINNPIIFIHGNSDQAIGNGTTLASWQTGFRDLIQYLISKGYKESELYITTWGPANPNLASQQAHTCKYVTTLRKFVEAVIAYTGAKKINVIAHSMGVTLARKVLQGGSMTDSTGSCQIGDPLTNYVDTFVALAGATWGLQTCQFSFELPTCGKSNGFFPGTSAGTNGHPTGLSTYLSDINFSGVKEASYIYTLWNYPFDSIIGMETFYGHNTSEIIGQTATKVYNGVQWTHFDIRDATCDTVLKAIQTHTLN